MCSTMKAHPHQSSPCGESINQAQGLTRLERAYGLLAPLVFGAIQAIKPFWGACSEELLSRCGMVPPAGDAAIWFHGASAGEMSAARNL